MHTWNERARVVVCIVLSFACSLYYSKAAIGYPLYPCSTGSGSLAGREVEGRGG